MQRKPLESDWKIFKKRLPEWRERYLMKKNKEIIGILTDQHKTPTEQFWDAKKKMGEEARVLVDCLDGHSRSKMRWSLILMHRHGLIEDAGWHEFSEELRKLILASSRGFSM
jgi:hypothetical protein